MIKLFTDGSSHPQTNIGFGAYLLIIDDSKSLDELQDDIKLKMFENTSSTKLEVQTMLWALSNIDIKEEFVVYTDCQNIIGLANRRKRFESNNYLTKKGNLIANHELYKEFYKLTDNLNCQFIKVKGHKETSQKDEIDKIFTLVDKAARDKLRNELL
jgi:ribonuclease HI